jgi:uncharacterized protein involved in exopolysaccharide biosynthesis
MSAESPDVAAPGAFSLIGVVNFVLRNRRIMIGIPLGMMLFTVAWTLAAERQYKAAAIIAPQVEARGGRLASLAAQIGFGTGAGTGDGVEFYKVVLTSRDLLAATALTEYEFARGPGDTLRGNLIALFKVEGRTNHERLLAAIKLLQERVSTGINWDASLLTLEVKAPWPELALQINLRMLELFGEFNVGQLQSRAASERRFVEGRLDEARRDLEAAEADLESFLEQNRRYQDSPQLLFEFARQQRRVDLRQQVFLTLSQMYEQARIEEVRNTPVFTIVDHPERSVQPAGRGLVTNTIVAMLMGLIIGTVVVLTLEYVNNQKRRNVAEYASFVALRRAALADVLPRRVLRVFRHLPIADAEEARAIAHEDHGKGGGSAT